MFFTRCTFILHSLAYFPDELNRNSMETAAQKKNAKHLFDSTIDSFFSHKSRYPIACLHWRSRRIRGGAFSGKLNWVFSYTLTTTANYQRELTCRSVQNSALPRGRIAMPRTRVAERDLLCLTRFDCRFIVLIFLARTFYVITSSILPFRFFLDPSLVLSLKAHQFPKTPERQVQSAHTIGIADKRQGKVASG